ncbi:pelle-like serine/threonine-protein kinase pik-1 [Athalia rosae]|uniref:pelle-like serine/threonine-protein kinase pik-1 n=1 Tax=Athalia rosae TaxID=37344 RepID=UPI0020345B18|nr:pelle-like serine/threonine-protein kinase pik-1 [Athalia rosae]
MDQNNRPTEIKYIHKLPWLVKMELSALLDRTSKWVELAGKHMKFDSLTIEELKRSRTPTENLLNRWSYENLRTILELFKLLSEMQHYKAMNILRPFVDVKYHGLIDEGEGNFKRLFGPIEVNGNSKDLKIGSQNFDQVQPVRIDNPKIIVNQSANEEGVKILNGKPELGIGILMSESDNTLVPSDGASSSPDVCGSAPTLQPTASTASTKKNLANSGLPLISYNELATATNGWSSVTVLGRGSFGTVFKGIWKNTPVAIKRLEQRVSDTNGSYVTQLQQSLRELNILNSYRHDNILPLYAYSMGPEPPCLVYQFMPNGSLQDRLQLKYRTKPLTWLQRHEIAKGTARGLQYLHTRDKPLIHGDIKSANILLDKNFEPRIGDFGLAREGPEKNHIKVSGIRGTRPYLPNEFLHDKILSTKIDTYSYGIVLFELATGLPACVHWHGKDGFVKDIIGSYEEKDLNLFKDVRAGKENDQVFDHLIELGKLCSKELSNDRPDMVDVLKSIEEY